jgi:hypothetical protein
MGTKWVQKFRVSSGNEYPRFESDLAGGTCQCANQILLSAEAIRLPQTVGPLYQYLDPHLCGDMHRSTTRAHTGEPKNDMAIVEADPVVVVWADQAHAT